MRFRSALVCAVAFMPCVALTAQSPAQVEALAPLLMSEDRRVFDPALYVRAFNDPDTMVRRYAVMSAAHIRNRRATASLLPLLSDRDSTVVANTMFALGQLMDTSAIGPIVARMSSPDAIGSGALQEGATAVARIGGADAAHFIDGILTGGASVPAARLTALVPAALLESWRLGPLMPAQSIARFLTDTSADLRWRAAYALGRNRSPVGAALMVHLLRDQTPIVREVAARALTRRYADTAHIAAAVVPELLRALDGDQPGTRISALNSLATFADSALTSKVLPLLADADLNVRVAAAAALGELKGSVAAHALDAAADKDKTWAVRRASLLGLARADTALALRRAATWLAATDFRDRLVALQAIGATRTPDRAAFRTAVADADARVQAAAISGWRGMRGDTTVYAVAREHLRSTSPLVRAAAASALGQGASAADVDALVAAWTVSQQVPTSDGRLAILNALHGAVRRSPELFGTFSDPARQAILHSPADPLLREEAARSWPELSQVWGPRAPINTGMTLDQYRNIVRTLLLSGDDPHVLVEVAGRGTIEIDLLAHEAPLTVANFLRLVDRHYFDNNQWHRVVPDFVVQDGDPTGTGEGGPGWSIRDEINRERYVAPMVGMALSGPDTGGSQWFINVSPQPHLDGQYTIFGKVSGSYGALMHVVQGDLIRSIHR